jgi:hypothetical protein
MNTILSALVVAILAAFTLSAAPQITVHAVRGAYPGSPNFDAFVANAIQDVRFGRLEHLAAGELPATPTNYTTYLPGDKLTWQALTSTTNAPSYNGSLSPSEQFAQERGWCVSTIADIKSADGSNSINLRMLRVSITSGDPLNLLGYTPAFQGESYYPHAIGIKADGSVLDFYESGDIMVARIIIRITGPMFTGETPDAIVGIANYVLGIDNFTYTAEARLADGFGKVVLETNPSVVVVPVPAVLTIATAVDSVTVTSSGNGLLQMSGDMVTWTDVGPVTPGVPVAFLTETQQFFRVLGQ